jgi:hypothetical protein
MPGERPASQTRTGIIMLLVFAAILVGVIALTSL